MNRSFLKSTPLRLNLDLYQELHLSVLRRDGWRCQSCGSMKQLEVHHQQYRSDAGEDVEDNLITLCRKCHNSEHRPSVSLKDKVITCFLEFGLGYLSCAAAKSTIW